MYSWSVRPGAYADPSAMIAHKPTWSYSEPAKFSFTYAVQCCWVGLDWGQSQRGRAKNAKTHKIDIFASSCGFGIPLPPNW